MSNEFRPRYAGIGRSSHSTGTSTNTAQAGWTVAGSRSTARQNRFRLDDYLNEASRENRVQEGWSSRGGDWGTDDWGTNDGWDNDWAAESGWGTAGDWDAGVTSRSTPGGVPPEEDRKCLGCQRIFGDAKGLLSHRDGSPNTANRFTCEAESCSFASCSLSGLRNHHRTLGHGAEIPSVSTDSIDSFPPLGSSTPSSGASRSSTGVSSNSSTSATNTWAEISAPRRATIGHSASTSNSSDTRTRGSAVNFNTATPRVSSADTSTSTPASTSSTRPSGRRTWASLSAASMTRCEQCLQLMKRADLEQHVIDFHPAIECWGCSKGFRDEDGLLQVGLFR
ncbi:hypothetical protein FRC02_005247 [Tulasnella sp. 418]|nr:hypothetical protein FRC02_005247 [Tulasnella sp. 418]